MMLFMYGADRVRSQAYRDAAVQKFRAERDPEGLNTRIVRADAVSAGAVYEELMTPPFLAEKRCLVIEDPILRGSSELHELLFKCVNEELPLDSVVLFLHERSEKPKKASKRVLELFDACAALPYTAAFPLLTGPKLEAYIGSLFSNLGATIDPGVATRLAERCNEDMEQLSHIVKQLAAHSGYTRVRVQDVDLFVRSPDDDNVFTLAEYIVSGRAKDAAAMLLEQYRIGEDAQFVFSMVTRQVRIMLQVQQALDSGLSLKDSSLPKTLGLHPFVLKKTGALVSRVSSSELLPLYEELLNMDIAQKTGGLDLETSLERFLVRRVKT